MPEKTIFQQIIDKEIPAEFVHEDDLCVGIKDINPKAPIHFLIIPRKPIHGIDTLQEEDRTLISHLIFTAKDLATKHKCEGYQLRVNVGEKGGQIVPHLHIHLMGWPA